MPAVKQMSERMESVLTAIYLVFNEGYAATRGDRLVRVDLCSEAIRLVRLIHSLMQPQPPEEATGLLALMLLHDARREARYDAEGNPVLLEEQDRTLWDRTQIGEGLSLVEETMNGTPDAFAIQAAIAAVHCCAARAENTDWHEILRLYNLLATVQPSPIVSLNRAVAVAMTQGSEAALAILENLARDGELDDYHLFHSARADLFRRTGLQEQAAASYQRGIALAKTTESVPG